MSRHRRLIWNSYIRLGRRALGAERLLHGYGSAAHRAKDGQEQRVGEVVEGLDVRHRHHEHMAMRQRRAVEDRDYVVVAVDDLRRELAVSDLTERTCHSIVAACTDVTYGRYCATRLQLSPSFLLAHTSPFAVPK